MTENSWGELWEGIEWNRVTTIPFITERIHEIKAMGDRLKEKAEKWDNLVEKSMEAPYIDCVGNAEKLESVREFVLSRKYDIKMDIENFGMLKPVLTYFLKEAEG